MNINPRQITIIIYLLIRTRQTSFRNVFFSLFLSLSLSLLFDFSKMDMLKSNKLFRASQNFNTDLIIIIIIICFTKFQNFTTEYEENDFLSIIFAHFQVVPQTKTKTKNLAPSTNLGAFKGGSLPNVSKQNRKHQTSNRNKVQTTNEVTNSNTSNKKVLSPIIFCDDIHNCMHTCAVFMLLILCLQNNCFSFSLKKKKIKEDHGIYCPFPNLNSFTKLRGK